jgi:hypothetical protein
MAWALRTLVLALFELMDKLLEAGMGGLRKGTVIGGCPFAAFRAARPGRYPPIQAEGTYRHLR